LTKILIPRSDSVSAKVVEPSDFEKMFSQDFIRDYIVSGFTVSSATGLSVDITLGEARLKGLHIESTATENVASLTANTSNYIYITLSRDGNSEAESWDFSKNTSGTIPTDSILLAKVTTNGSSVTGVDISERVITHQNMDYDEFWFGDGSDGDVTISSSTTFNTPKNYNDLTINASQTLSYNGADQTNAIIRVKGTLTVNGTLSATGKGRAGGDGGSATTQNGAGGSQGDTGIQSWGADLTSGASGSSGAGGTGGSSGAGSGASGTSGVSGDLRIVADTRFNDATEILRAQPQIYGAGGSGGAGGGAGGGTSGYSSGGNGGTGGAGGNGGGTLLVFAKNITIASGGIIESNGADGADGGNGTAGSGSQNYTAGGGGGAGSGGGGSGGFIGVVYELLTNNGSINVNGGSTGSAGTGGTSAYGGTGADGSTGSAGGLGIKKTYQI